MIVGTVYGVVLNDRRQCDLLAPEFTEKPYARAPEAPIVYIKPHVCLRFAGAPVPVPVELREVEAAATIALLFGVPGVPVAAALALDVCEPHTSFYRPAIRQRCRDGFLPMGMFARYEAAALAGDIVTRIDGAEAHRWSLDRLVRDVPTLIADLSAFMTLADGDALLIGLPGDAPRVAAGALVEVAHDALPPLSARFEREAAR